MQYDVLVVGAGLAGLQCARLLAQRGLNVAIIDRKTTVAAPVHTTGIFVRKTWEDFPLPDEQLGPGIRDVVLYSPSRRSFTLHAQRDEFRIGSMNWLNLWLLEQCVRAGATWMPGTRFVGGAQVKARFIIGADGPRSAVAQHLGLDSNRELLVGLEEVVPPISREPVLHCFLDPELAPGYIGWIANDGREAHVGVAGYRNGWDPARALQKFRESAPFAIGKAIERRGGLIPVGGILRRIASPRGLLVGDAAGAVSPLTAGGLDGALRLSTFAAEVVAAYLDSGDASGLREYSGDRYRARFMTRRWMRRAIRALSAPPLMELAFSMLHMPFARGIAEHVFFARGSFPDIGRAPVFTSPRA